MADEKDKLKIENEGDLKNNDSDLLSSLNSSSETVDLEVDEIKSPNLKKKNDKTLEINLNVESPDDHEEMLVTPALMNAMDKGEEFVSEDDEEDEDLAPEIPEEMAPETPTPLEKNPKPEEKVEEKNPTGEHPQEEPENKTPGQPTEKNQSQENQQTNQSPEIQEGVPQQTEETPPTPPADQSQLPETNQPQPNNQLSKIETTPNKQQPQTAKTPPTVNQQPHRQIDQEQFPPQSTTLRTPPQINPEPQTSTKTESQTPPIISKDDLGNIGPHGGDPMIMRDNWDHRPKNSDQKQVGNNLDSEKLIQTNSNQPTNTNKTTPLETAPRQNKLDGQEWAELRERIHLAEDQEQREEEAYQKMNDLQKLNRTRQQKKLLKELKDKNDKLIGLVEKMLLKRYFPIVSYKIIQHQSEVGKLIKQLSKKKIIHRNDEPMNRLSSEIFYFDALVLHPILKTGAFKDAVKRFRNYWLSWAIEFWWWTVIMAIFDLLIIFPFVFLLFGSVFDGPGIRLLKKIRKRSNEEKDLVSEIKKLAKPKGGDDENYIYHKKSYED